MATSKLIDLTGLAEFKAKQDVANAAKYMTSSQVNSAIQNQISTAVEFKGSVAFANLPTSNSTGDMYNVTDAFTTTDSFSEGAGKKCKAGTNVVWNADGKWDLFAGGFDIDNATTSTAGLMSAADKSKLDGIAAGANKYTYTLPAATSSTLGGVKTGSNITNSSGTISITKDNVVAALGYTPSSGDTTYADMTGATASAAGAHGLVPAPAAGKQASYLRGDGTWQVPTNTTYSAATTSAAGLMSAADKTKLDGIASGANAYSLPTASASVLGGVKVGSNLSISNGVLSGTADTTYTAGSGLALSGRAFSIATGGVTLAMIASAAVATTAEIDALF